MTKKEKVKIPKYMIIIPILIPILVCLIALSLHNGKFDSLLIITLLFNIGMEIIPYCILVAVWKRISAWKSIDKQFGIMGAFILLLISQTFWEIIHWISYYATHPDTTFTIAVFFLTSGIIGGIGYGIGWLIGHLVLTNKKSSFN